MMNRPRLDLLVLGHIDAGKSTIFGHFIYKCGMVDKKIMEKVEKESIEQHTASRKWARLTRQYAQPGTIGVSLCTLEIPRFEVTIIDAMDTGASIFSYLKGDGVALLVVSAPFGEFEDGISTLGLTKAHAMLSYSMGLRKMIVLVNKMDSVNWSQKRFLEIVSEMSRILRKNELQFDSLSFIPVSGWTGENLLDRPKESIPWYDGPSLLEAVDNLRFLDSSINKPLRMPIMEVYDSSRGALVTGRIETGTLLHHSTVHIAPLSVIGSVSSIEMDHVQVNEANSGSIVTVTLEGVRPEQIERGHILSSRPILPYKLRVFSLKSSSSINKNHFAQAIPPPYAATQLVLPPSLTHALAAKPSRAQSSSRAVMWH